MSGDVIVDDETFLQFELAMACIANRECYSTFCSDIYITINFLYTWSLICSFLKFLKVLGGVNFSRRYWD